MAERRTDSARVRQLAALIESERHDARTAMEVAREAYE
jgi:hypothetical protein